jgi:hypothetical protein
MKKNKPIPVEGDLIVLENREDLVKNSTFHIMFDHETASVPQSQKREMYETCKHQS